MRTQIEILGPGAYYTAHLNTEAFECGAIYRAWEARVVEARDAAERAKGVTQQIGPYTVTIGVNPCWTVRTGDAMWTLDDIASPDTKDCMTLEVAEAVLIALKVWAS